MKDFLNSLVTLLTLLAGIVIGILIGPRMEQTALAYQSQIPICVNSATVECVTPVITIDAGAIGKLLSNQIATNQVTVNGYDLLKLQNKLITELLRKQVLTGTEARFIIDSSHPDKQLQLRAANQGGR
jgi:hypothetical protein